MPIYVYQCDSCGVTFQHRQSFNDTPLADCPECDGHVHRVIQPVGIVFKGSGFYVTDNKAKSSTAMPGGNAKETKEEKGAAETETNSSSSNDSGSGDTDS